MYNQRKIERYETQKIYEQVEDKLVVSSVYPSGKGTKNRNNLLIVKPTEDYK